MKTITTLLILILATSIIYSANAQTNVTKTNEVILSAEVEDGQTYLHWFTSKESNSSYFILQKSTDGIEYSDIGAKSASGSSLFPRSYETMDPADSLGKIFYRVILVTMEGKRISSYPLLLNTNAENDSNSVAVK